MMICPYNILSLCAIHASLKTPTQRVSSSKQTAASVGWKLLSTEFEGIKMVQYGRPKPSNTFRW